MQTATGMSVTSFMFSFTSLSLALSSVLQLMMQHRRLLLVCLSLPLCSLSPCIELHAAIASQDGSEQTFQF